MHPIRRSEACSPPSGTLRMHLLFLVACISFLTLCNFGAAEDKSRNNSGDNRPTTGKAHSIKAEYLTLPLCKKRKGGASISAVGVDYHDQVTFILKTGDTNYYRQSWPHSAFDEFPHGFDANDIYGKSGHPLASSDALPDLKDQTKEFVDRFSNVIGNHTITLQQYFFNLLANCDIHVSDNKRGSRAGVLRYLEPNKLLVNNFSDALPEDAVEFQMYDSNSGNVLDKILVRMDPYMLPMRASLPLGESGNYVMLTERNVGERPIRSGVRLLQLSPLQPLDSIVFSYENVIVTAISKPTNDSEIRISLSGHPYVITCRLSSGSDNMPRLEVVEDRTPPVTPGCIYASDFKYFDPWTTWITNEKSYVVHFWNPDLGWYMLDLAPYTVFDDRYFPDYHFSTPSSMLLLYQSKRNRPVYLFKPDLPAAAK